MNILQPFLKSYNLLIIFSIQNLNSYEIDHAQHSQCLMVLVDMEQLYFSWLIIIINLHLKVPHLVLPLLEKLSRSKIMHTTKLVNARFMRCSDKTIITAIQYFIDQSTGNIPYLVLLIFPLLITWVVYLSTLYKIFHRCSINRISPPHPSFHHQKPTHCIKFALFPSTFWIISWFFSLGSADDLQEKCYDYISQMFFSHLITRLKSANLKQIFRLVRFSMYLSRLLLITCDQTPAFLINQQSYVFI